MTGGPVRSGPKITIWPNSTSSAEFRVSETEVLQFTASAGVDSVGTFSLTLAPREVRGSAGAALVAFRRWADLYRRLPRLSVVSIGYDVPGGIMLGLITSVHVTRDRTTGSLAVAIGGEGIGRLLTQDTTEHIVTQATGAADFEQKVKAVLGANHPVLNATLNLLGPVEAGRAGSDPEAARTPIAATVKELIDWVLDTIPSMRMPVLRRLYGGPAYPDEGGSGSPRDVFQTSFSVFTWNDARIYTDPLQSYHGDVYGLIRGAIDADFYEVFVDSVPSAGADQPTIELIVRPKPFDSKKMEILPVSEETGLTWEDLTTRYEGREHHEIDEDMVLSDSLGWDLSDVATYFSVVSDNDIIGSSEAQDAGLAYPVLDLYLILTGHGVKASRSSVRLMGGELAAAVAENPDYTSEQTTQVVEFRNRLYNWHRWNAWMVKGTITVHGKDEYRHGEKYVLPWAMPPVGFDDPNMVAGMEFYGTSVTWSWQQGRPYTCTISLARGHSDAMLKAVRDEIRALAPEDNPNMVASV